MIYRKKSREIKPLVRRGAYYIPGLNRIFISINKNASTSCIQAIKAAGHGRERFHFADLDDLRYKDVEISTMWRDPLRRMESTYRMYRAIRKGKLLGLGFSDWVIRLCQDGTPDPHIYSQYRHVTHNKKWLPHKVFKWNFDEFADYWGVKSVKQINKSVNKIPDYYTDLEWTPSAESLFRRVYKRDFEVWTGENSGRKRI